MFRNTKEPSSGGELSVPSQSYMWFNGTIPCELGQYCGGVYKLWCVCVYGSLCDPYTHTHTPQTYATKILTEFTWTSTIEPHVTLARHR